MVEVSPGPCPASAFGYVHWLEGIEYMSSTITGSDIAQGLHQLGVWAGMTLEVHCSLSQFGHVEGGAKTVIDMLIPFAKDQM